MRKGWRAAASELVADLAALGTLAVFLLLIFLYIARVMALNRNPHPFFAILWSLWFMAVLVAIMLPNSPQIGLLVLVLFMPIEITAVAWETKSRDTLSELATWCIKTMSPHSTPGRGWNALLLFMIMCITYLLARTFMAYSGSAIMSLSAFVLGTIWLHDHWLSPEKHG